MDFALLHKGVELATLAAAALNISIAQPPSSPQKTEIEKPALIESKNLPEENEVVQDLSFITKNDEISLKMVTKEANPLENNLLVTVEEPEKVFTVFEPTPKPSATPVAKASEEPEDAPLPSKKPVTSPKPESSKQPEKTEEKKETKSPEPSPTPTSVPVGNLNSPNADLLFKMTNDHRAKIGKAAFEKDERLCKIAEQRAPQVNGELATGTLHKGFKALNLPYWATENLAAYSTVQEDFNFLVNDYIHRVAIESDHKYSCVACVGASCSQIFSSFVSK